MTLRVQQALAFRLVPSALLLLLLFFYFFFSSLCSAQPASGEVARRHRRPCAHYTCINSVRKSSGQTFQALLLTLPWAGSYWQPGDFQGARGHVSSSSCSVY